MVIAPGLGRWAAIAAVSARAAGASAGADDMKLSQRLVPAAGAAGAVLAGYAAESGALRDYVTSGRPAAIEPFKDAVGQMPGRQARVAALVRGYPHMPD